MHGGWTGSAQIFTMCLSNTHLRRHPGHLGRKGALLHAPSLSSHSLTGTPISRYSQASHRCSHMYPTFTYSHPHTYSHRHSQITQSHRPTHTCILLIFTHVSTHMHTCPHTLTHMNPLTHTLMHPHRALRVTQRQSGKQTLSTGAEVTRETRASRGGDVCSRAERKGGRPGRMSPVLQGSLGTEEDKWPKLWAAAMCWCVLGTSASFASLCHLHLLHPQTPGVRCACGPMGPQT